MVADEVFGCSSSRDVAVSALLDGNLSLLDGVSRLTSDFFIAARVIFVIAKSFAFIYACNQLALGLLGIVISDPEFYETAAEGEEISIDLDKSIISVGGKEFPFKLALMERELIEAGGISEAFRKFGKMLFDVMCAPKAKLVNGSQVDGPNDPTGDLS
jgi:3-isopropylmalate dehydratase small subunit